jgi:hypothetical protein
VLQLLRHDDPAADQDGEHDHQSEAALEHRAER